jgi:acyl dehydratase
MTIQLSRPADLLGMVGQEIGTGDWHAITRRQVNIFADATHDHQWIHVDPERAAKGACKAGIRRTEAGRPRVRVRGSRRAREVGSAGLRHRDGRDLPVAPPITKRRSNYQGSAIR